MMNRQSMTLISSELNGNPTFRMIPLDLSCPFNEAVFEPVTKVLAIISKEKKNTLKMAAKMNEFGDPEPVKRASDRPLNKPPYKEQRLIIETFYEYHLTNKDDVSNFIKMFAVNADTFDLTTFWTD